MVAFLFLFARSRRYWAVSGTTYSSEPGNGVIPAFLQAWYSSTDAAMLPWSVIANAGWPMATAWSTMSATGLIASFTEYRECACRCQNGVRTIRIRGVLMIFIVLASRSVRGVVLSTSGLGDVGCGGGVCGERRVGVETFTTAV